MCGGVSLLLLHLLHQTKLEEWVDDRHLHLVHDGWCEESADAIRYCMLLAQPAVVSGKEGEGRGVKGREGDRKGE